MKFLSNLHTHSTYCDGKNGLEDIIKHAIELNFVSIGISGHSYTYFDDCCCITKENTPKYIAELKVLKEKYKDKIEVYIGLENDYYSSIDKNKADEMGLDYRVCSVHYIKDEKDNYYTMDKSADYFKSVIEHFGSAEIVINKYYDTVIEMIKNVTPEIIGHLDVIRKHNRNNILFDENAKYYKQKINEVLDVIENSNAIVEVNTNKITVENKDMHYPSKMVLREILKRNIPITLSADAHRADRINYCFDEMSTVLKNMGFKTLKILHGGAFRDISL